MTTVGVAGYLVRHPVGGNAWTFAHYLVGLHRLGVRVYYVEESGWDQPCYDPGTRSYGDDPAAGLRRAGGLLAKLGAAVPVFYVDRRDGTVFGGTRRALERLLARTELLLDVGGVCDLPEFDAARRRALVDLDPGFTQAGRFGGRHLQRYDVHFSYGLNIGRPSCPIPTHGLVWHPTVPPVVRDAWHTDEEPRHPPVFTTVASLDAYGSVRIDGRVLGQKWPQLQAVLDLPARDTGRFELALSGGTPATIDALRAAGWQVSAAARLDDVDRYRRFVQGSAGELSVAKQAYVATGSGWVSDRTVGYLAAGRPAVVEDTGMRTRVPVGAGLLTFRSAEEALGALGRVRRNRAAHAAAARELAREHFDATTVLKSVLDRALTPGP